MSVDPIFWLLAAIGFVVLEAMTLNHRLHLVCRGQRRSPAELPGHRLVPGAGGGVRGGQHPLPAGPQAPVRPAAQAAHGHATATAPLAGRPSC